MFDAVKNYALLALAALCVVLSLSTCEYRRQYESTAFALSVQNDAIKAQAEEANRKLVRLTEQRDQNQLLLNESVGATAKIQKGFDDFLKTVRAATGPTPAISVRVQACDAGGGGGSPSPGLPGRPAVGFGKGSTTAQLLSPTAARRTEDELISVEELSRDFNLCQTALLARVKVEKK